MSIVLSYVLGIMQRKLPTSITNPPGKPRKKLSKPSRGIDIYKCNDFDVVLARTCLTCLTCSTGSTCSTCSNHVQADDDTRTGVQDRERGRAAQPHTIEFEEHQEKTQPPFVPTKKQLPLSNNSLLSIYSMDEMDMEPFKRTRAKTPCFWIGHLDAKTRDPATADTSKVLANQYQAVLPPRTFTPFPELSIQTSDPKHHPPKTLRKVKGQQSLRDLVTCQEKHEKSRLSVSSCSDSESETLVGTPSLGSPTTSHFSWKTCDEYLSSSTPSENGFTTAKEDHDDDDDESKDIGFKICLDLLTSELATGLFKKHPTEKLDRASGLQILLMIEAYESVQAHIRQEIEDAHVMGEKLEEVRGVERTLNNWLGALYALYDRIRGSKSNGSLRDGVEAQREGEGECEPTKPLRPRKSFRKGSIDSDFDGFRFEFDGIKS